MNHFSRAITTICLFVIVLISTGCGGGGNGANENDGDAIRYVALGPSDTATGVGAVPTTEGYVFRIRNELDEDVDKDVNLTNLGTILPGAGIETIRLEVGNYLGFNRSADLVTIAPGGNDISDGDTVEEFSANLTTILNQLRGQTSAFIVISNIPDFTQLPHYINEFHRHVTIGRIILFNNAIAQAAAAFNVPVVDLFSNLNPLEDMLVSEVHTDSFYLSDKGHEKVANLFLEIIGPQLAD